MATIVIDAGHGGRDNGASYNGRLEKDDNLALALEVGEILEEAGNEVIYTRTEDVYQSPAEKARIANASGADYFLSIHRNSGEIPNQYSGVQSLIYGPGGIKEEIGENINENLSDLGFQNLGISFRPNLTVLKRTQMPAILVEAGFINNDRDNLIFDEQFEEIARGIAEGVTDAIGSPIRGTAASLTSGAKHSPSYRVQLGIFSKQENATTQYEQLLGAGYPVEIVRLGSLYAILSDSFQTAAEAKHYANSLQEGGFDVAIIVL